MAKYKRYDYKQMLMIPISLEDQLSPGTLEFAIHTLVETRMDLSLFDEKYKNDETGRLAYDPKILLKVVLFAYSRGLTGSRGIEQACRENVVFMALSCGVKPDHSTICGFVSSMKGEIAPLFRDVLLVCEEEGLLGGTFFALDGLKLSSNASKEWSGSHAELQRKKDRLEAKVKQLLEEHEGEDKGDDDPSRPGSFRGSASRERQIKRLHKQAERIEKWLKENEAKIGSNGKEISSNITDNDSGQMITSHGFIQGYNGQALVDDKHQVVVHAEAFGTVSDHEHVGPIMAGAKENMQAIGHDEDYFAGATSRNAKSWSWTPISLTDITAGGIPDMRLKNGTGPSGRGFTWRIFTMMSPMITMFAPMGKGSRLSSRNSTAKALFTEYISPRRMIVRVAP